MLYLNLICWWLTKFGQSHIFWPRQWTFHSSTPFSRQNWGQQLWGNSRPGGWCSVDKSIVGLLLKSHRATNLSPPPCCSGCPPPAAAEHANRLSCRVNRLCLSFIWALLSRFFESDACCGRDERGALGKVGADWTFWAGFVRISFFLRPYFFFPFWSSFSAAAKARFSRYFILLLTAAWFEPPPAMLQSRLMHFSFESAASLLDCKPDMIVECSTSRNPLCSE